MHAFKKFLSAIFSIYAFLIFLALMLILFPFVVIASFFGKVKGGNMIYVICKFWSDAGMLLWGMYHKNIFESPHDPGHAVVFVFNHISYIDIPVLLKSFGRQHIRVLGKAEMGKIPIFGFIYRKAAVMVQRGSVKNRAQSIQVLKLVLEKNISVVIAPEGTFNMTHHPLKEFYDGAFRIAIETQTPIKPVVFLDTYDRLNYKSIFSFTPGRSRAVFLEQVEVKEYSLDDINALKGKVYDMMQKALIKYKASWIKEGDNDSGK